MTRRLLEKRGLRNCFSGGSSDKEPSANAGDIRDAGQIPGLGRSPGGGHGNPLQYSCLENPMDRGGCQGYSPQGPKELDTSEETQHTHMWFLHTHLDPAVLLTSSISIQSLFTLSCLLSRVMAILVLGTCFCLASAACSLD